MLKILISVISVLIRFTYRFRSYIPIEFLIGFYVAEVVRRYWDQFMSLPFPDRLALKLVSYVPGKVRLIFVDVCVLSPI